MKRPHRTHTDMIVVGAGTETGGRELLAARPVRGAHPDREPPWPLSRTTRIAHGPHVRGDHRAAGAVLGATASGTRTAREVLAGRAR
ncbi:hypothetical protein [Streptomyces sp. NPDC058992]|uniref:hypothetical protein n=1 Tax=unclassified Streptomyces TaxID=2593676 RepID=UPI0036CED1C6